jgi:hypothetical protein
LAGNTEVDVAVSELELLAAEQIVVTVEVSVMQSEDADAGALTTAFSVAGLRRH